MENINPISTPMEVGLKLSKDNGGKKVSTSTLYRSLMGSPMYLTAPRPDLMFAVSMIGRFMESPTQSIHQLYVEPFIKAFIMQELKIQDWLVIAIVNGEEVLMITN